MTNLFVEAKNNNMPMTNIIIINRLMLSISILHTESTPVNKTIDKNEIMGINKEHSILEKRKYLGESPNLSHT